MIYKRSPERCFETSEIGGILGVTISQTKIISVKKVKKTYIFNDELIPQFFIKVRCLGILFDQSLHFKAHSTKVVDNCTLY